MLNLMVLSTIDCKGSRASQGRMKSDNKEILIENVYDLQ